MQSILITGGCGFIGSHTCISFLKQGFKLYIIDNNCNSSYKVLDKIYEIGLLENDNYFKRLHFIKGDIRSEKILSLTFQSYKNNEPIKAVIHFAGLKAVNKSIVEPLSYWENNVWGTITLLKVMQKFKCFNIVLVVVQLYVGKNLGVLKRIRVSQSIPTDIQSLLEKILLNLHESAENIWRISNLRYFNPIGSHESGLVENPLNVPDNLFHI